MAVPRKLRCRVSRTTDHSEHVYTVELAPFLPDPRSLIPDPRPPAFRPGQFLHLALDNHEPSRFWPKSRVFSIARPPSTLPLRVSYSVRGRYTRRMEYELTEGRTVWTKLPYGDFVIDSSRPAVLFVSGTGTTAFTAFIASLSPDCPHVVFLAYGARNPGLLIYREMLGRRAATVRGFRLSLVSEQSATGTQEGKLSLAHIRPQIEKLHGADCYLSGPPPMLDAISAELKELGGRPGAIRVDAWE